jgi:hypothetical protein
LGEADAVANDQRSETDNLRGEETCQSVGVCQIAIVNVTFFGLSAAAPRWLVANRHRRAGRGLCPMFAKPLLNYF